MQQLTQVHGFKISLYGVDLESNYHHLLGESMESDYKKAVMAKRRFIAEYPDTPESTLKVIIDNAIYLI